MPSPPPEPRRLGCAPPPTQHLDFLGVEDVGVFGAVHQDLGPVPILGAPRAVPPRRLVAALPLQRGALAARVAHGGGLRGHRKREGTGRDSRDPRDRPRTTPLRRRATARRAPLYLLRQPRLELRQERERNLTLFGQLLPPLSNFRFRPGPAKEGWSLGTERSRLARHHFRFRSGRVRSPAASGRSVRSRSGSLRTAPGTSFVTAGRRRSRAPFRSRLSEDAIDSAAHLVPMFVHSPVNGVFVKGESY